MLDGDILVLRTTSYLDEFENCVHRPITVSGLSLVSACIEKWLSHPERYQRAGDEILDRAE